MNRTDEAHLRRALKVASTSTIPRTKHGVVIASGKRVLSVGVNQHRNDQSICENPETEAHFHAEDRAIRALLLPYDNVDWSKVTLYSARLGVNGKPMMAMPCKFCAAMITRFGIKKVYWTVDGMTL